MAVPERDDRGFNRSLHSLPSNFLDYIHHMKSLKRPFGQPIYTTCITQCTLNKEKLRPHQVNKMPDRESSKGPLIFVSTLHLYISLSFTSEISYSSVGLQVLLHVWLHFFWEHTKCVQLWMIQTMWSVSSSVHSPISESVQWTTENNLPWF